jgi:hypothetical protein
MTFRVFQMKYVANRFFLPEPSCLLAEVWPAEQRLQSCSETIVSTLETLKGPKQTLSVCFETLMKRLVNQ